MVFTTERIHGASREVAYFSGLVDDRNRDLWVWLQSQFDFRIMESPEPGFLTYFEGDRVVIEVDREESSPAAFTHELLHIFLKAKGMCLIKDFREMVEQESDLRYIFTTSLRVHIGNCLEHLKMIPLFLERGFPRKDFVRDFHQPIFTWEELESLRENFYENHRPSIDCVDTYIGKFFAMKASANPDFEYCEILEGLQETAPSLFKVLNEFITSWDSLSIDGTHKEYLTPLQRFLEEIRGWAREIGILEI